MYAVYKMKNHESMQALSDERHMSHTMQIVNQIIGEEGYVRSSLESGEETLETIACQASVVVSWYLTEKYYGACKEVGRKVAELLQNNTD